jgi:hypothetical protein
LAANFGQIALLQAMLLHQKLQGLDAGDIGQGVMHCLIVFDEIAHDIDQPHGGMVFVTLGFIEQGFEHLGHLRIMRFVADGADIGGSTKLLPNREQTLNIDVCIHDENSSSAYAPVFHVPLS